MELLHQLLDATTNTSPDAAAISDRKLSYTYAQLSGAVAATASGFVTSGLRRGDRVLVWLPNCCQKVISLFGAIKAGGIFVPANAHLKAKQIAHILQDSDARFLVTTQARFRDLLAELPAMPDVKIAVMVDESPIYPTPQFETLTLGALQSAGRHAEPPTIDADIAAIFYTSGSTGKPKGVVLTHRNLILGARSVSSYLGNTHSDRILAALSLSFDYGFSQVTTAFSVGASVVLIDFVLPQEVLQTIEREKITGLAGVPPMWVQLADLPWPPSAPQTMRYITNSGGSLPRPTLSKLRHALPSTKVFLMYGLTEAFRSTYLPPEEISLRPDSIGRAIPGAEVLVLRPDGTPCRDDEPGELVHRGGLVSLGYWNDPEGTAERFRPISTTAPGRPHPEIAVWSGDVVRRDSEGFLYYIGRTDDLIKTSGHRVSPTEIEEEAYATGLVADAVAFGVPHPSLGQVIRLVATAPIGAVGDTEELMRRLRLRLPRFMLPTSIEWLAEMPRNSNGKYDRQAVRRNSLTPTLDAGKSATNECDTTPK